MIKGTKPTVLIVHCRYRQRGGEDTVVENEIRLLKKHGHRVFYYERNNAGFFLPHSVFFNLKVYSDIKKIIQKERIDIVHVHNTWMAMSRSVFYAACDMGVPAVQTLHNFRLICSNAFLYREGKICEECIRKGRLAGVRKRCYRGSLIFTALCAAEAALWGRSGISGKINYICLSEFNKEKILRINDRGRRVIDPDRIYVKPNFVWDRSGRSGAERSGFIFAGRLTEEKGVRVLIKAWELLGDEGPHLLIYGGGELEEWCKKEIGDKGLNVFLMGEVSHEKLMESMRRAEALIFPSVWYEGFPMTVIEALSAGTPVIAGDIGNGKQFLEDGRNGLLFKSGSAEDLARAVRDMMEKRVRFDEEDICIPPVCTPEGNYRLLREIYSKIISDGPC